MPGKSYAYDELDRKSRPIVNAATLSSGQKFYVSVQAKPRGETGRVTSFYLHADLRWYTSTASDAAGVDFGGYFDTRGKAEAALAQHDTARAQALVQDGKLVYSDPVDGETAMARALKARFGR